MTKIAAWRIQTSTKKFNGKPCSYCAKEMRVKGPHNDQPSRDHVEPRSRGGNYSHGIIIACKGCNEERGDTPLSEWWFQLFRSGDRRAELVLTTIIRMTINEPARPSIRDREEGRRADLDDAGRQGDPAE